MYGWRKRIGLIVPSGNLNTEIEFHLLRLKGVTVHVERVIEVTTSDENIDEGMRLMNEDLPRAARYLADIKPNIIVWGCTGASFWDGPGHNTRLEKIIEDEVKIQAITTSTALVAALKELQLTKIGVATPYAQKTNTQLRAFLEGNGYKITAMNGLGLVGFSCGETYPQQAYRVAMEVDTPDAEGVLISCTDFPTREILDLLERDLGKPVITATQATIWYTLKQLGLSDPIEDYGELLRRPR